jgi:hypothetical protein
MLRGNQNTSTTLFFSLKGKEFCRFILFPPGRGFRCRIVPNQQFSWLGVTLVGTISFN